MTNNSVWPSPDTQVAQQGRSDVHGVYLLDPTTQKAVAPSTSSVGTALTPYGSNPAQTAAAGADTLYKFGVAGTTSFTHVSGQNNTAANAYLAFDQSTTGAGNQVYVIASGQAYAFDRLGTVLHFSSAAQQNFGGQSGITVEAFA